MSLRLVSEVDRATIVELDSELRLEVFTEVGARLNDVRVLSGPDSSEDGVVARSLEAGWGEFVAFANSRAFLDATTGPSDDDRTVSSTVARLSTSLGILTEQLQTQELQQAQRRDARPNAPTRTASRCSGRSWRSACSPGWAPRCG